MSDFTKKMNRTDRLMYSLRNQFHLRRDPRRARNWGIIMVALGVLALWSGSIMLSLLCGLAFLRFSFLLVRWQDNLQREWERRHGAVS